MTTSFKKLILGGAITAASLLSVGCDGSYSGSATASGSGAGVKKYNISVSVGCRWLTPTMVDACLAPGETKAGYTLTVEGFPKNRALLKAEKHHKSEDGRTITSEPMTLTTGEMVDVAFQVGAETLTFTVAVEALSTLPDGTYQLNSPGMVETITDALQRNLDSPFTLDIAPSTNSILGVIGSNFLPNHGHMKVEFSPADTALMAQLPTTLADLRGKKK